jgi:RNA polymerase sigma-70 factor (ECF subfamily)
MNRDPPAGEPRRREFDALYDRHGREVWAVAYARRLDADLALDVTQEAFLRLWKQWEAGDAIANPRAWLLRVARNLAEDHVKSAFHRNGTQEPSVLNGVHAAELPPLDRLARAELFAQIRAGLDELPPADREILTFRYSLDYDATRIAELLGIAVTAVHMRLSRARQRLADRLTAQGVTKPP